MKLIIAIPAFNESKVIAGVIADVQKLYPEAQIVVIDDGSSDTTATVASNHGALVLKHRMNRGLGGAIGTAILWAKRQGADALVTIDADGQHDPADIAKVLEPIQHSNEDVVVGSRMHSLTTSMPLDRKILNTLANGITWLFFGIATTDSQSGFRGFSKRALQQIRLRTQRMEVSSEIFAEVYRLKLNYAEVPIQVIYSEYSRAKGQSNSNSLSIIFRLMLRLFR